MALDRLSAIEDGSTLADLCSFSDATSSEERDDVLSILHDAANRKLTPDEFAVSMTALTSNALLVECLQAAYKQLLAQPPIASNYRRCDWRLDVIVRADLLTID